MKNEKKELVKKFKAVIADMLDNYEQYTAEEKAQIKEIFEKATKLNTILDKYDNIDVACKKDWTAFLIVYGHFFEPTIY